jgi:diacylglycerol kinase
MEDRLPRRSGRPWVEKFRCAFRGTWWGIRGQRSFVVHFAFAAAVLACAAGFRVSKQEWCLLLLCMALVWGAEMFNSALENLAKAISEREHVQLGVALDISSGAVLVAALGAAAVGTVIFLDHLAKTLGWW